MNDSPNTKRERARSVEHALLQRVPLSQGQRIISPLWSPKGDIESKYHSAALALARSKHFLKHWKERAYQEREARFFRIRDKLIEACEAAASHDWGRDRDQHDIRRSIDSKAKELAAATRVFRQALQGRGLHFWAPQKLAFILSAKFDQKQLSQDDLRRQTSTIPATATFEALEAFADFCDEELDRGQGRFQFGPIFFDPMPSRLPANEVALAVKLADLFTTYRTDDHGMKDFYLSGRDPRISDDTPWAVLAQFVNAAMGTNRSGTSLQVSVGNAKNAGARV